MMATSLRCTICFHGEVVSMADMGINCVYGIKWPGRFRSLYVESVS